MICSVMLFERCCSWLYSYPLNTFIITCYASGVGYTAQFRLYSKVQVIRHCPGYTTWFRLYVMVRVIWHGSGYTVQVIQHSAGYMAL